MSGVGSERRIIEFIDFQAHGAHLLAEHVFASPLVVQYLAAVVVGQ